MPTCPAKSSKTARPSSDKERPSGIAGVGYDARGSVKESNPDPDKYNPFIKPGNVDIEKAADWMGGWAKKAARLNGGRLPSSRGGMQWRTLIAEQAGKDGLTFAGGGTTAADVKLKERETPQLQIPANVIGDSPQGAIVHAATTEAEAKAAGMAAGAGDSSVNDNPHLEPDETGKVNINAATAWTKAFYEGRRSKGVWDNKPQPGMPDK